jgi:hypothetical protein
VDGNRVESGTRGDSIGPATGTVIGQYVTAGAEEAERASALPPTRPREMAPSSTRRTSRASTRW